MRFAGHRSKTGSVGNIFRFRGAIFYLSELLLGLDFPYILILGTGGGRFCRRELVGQLLGRIGFIAG